MHQGLMSLLAFTACSSVFMVGVNATDVEYNQEFSLTGHG